MTEQEAREIAICKSYDYDDEFYVYQDPDDSPRYFNDPSSMRYFVLSGTSRDMGYGGVENLDPIACYSAGELVS